MRHPAGRLVRMLLLVLATAAVLILVVSIGLRSSWGRAHLARQVQQQAERLIDADVSIGGISGNLFSSPTLHDLTISRDGTPLMSAESVQVRYDLRGVLGGDIAVDSVTLIKPVFHLREGPDGIALFDLFSRKTTPPGPRRSFVIAPIVIRDGRVLIGPEVDNLEAVAVPGELRDLQATIGIEQSAASTRIHVEQLSFTGANPRLELHDLSGDIVITGDDLKFESVQVVTAGSRFVLSGSVAGVTAFGRSE